MEQEKCKHELYQRGDKENKTWCRFCGKIICEVCNDIDKCYEETGICENIPR